MTELTLYAPKRALLKCGLSARVLVLLPRGIAIAVGAGNWTPEGVTDGSVEPDPADNVVDAVDPDETVTMHPIEAPKN